MKGIVFNLLEEVVSQKHGEDTWDALLNAARLEGAYTSLGSYPDEHLTCIVGAASSALKLPAQDIVRWFGVHAMPLMVERYPYFFEGHKSTRSFLLTLNDIIHPEVRKLYPGADVPVFEFDTSSENELRMGYQSPRKMCAFAEGLILGAAEHFGEKAGIEQPRCMLRGDEKCEFHISFRKRDRT